MISKEKMQNDILSIVKLLFVWLVYIPMSARIPISKLVRTYNLDGLNRVYELYQCVLTTTPKHFDLKSRKLKPKNYGFKLKANLKSKYPELMEMKCYLTIFLDILSMRGHKMEPF